MRGALTLVLALFVCGFVSTALAAGDAIRESRTRVPVVDGPGVVLTSSGTSAALAARETAGPDTFALYGGPDEATEGKFQMANGVTPDWGGGNGLPQGYGGGPDAWWTVDITDQPVYWHRSQFNAQTLGTAQPAPNHAMWSGVEADDPLADGWAAAPGYGNQWDDILIYESPPLADPSVAQDVSLDFYFHYDVEPGYDYFIVEYDSAGFWTEVLARTGYQSEPWGTFVAPGTRFIDEQTRPIRYAGNDYGGDFGDRIRIRMRVESDGAWSNQDGLWPSVAGAAQVDQISLTTSQGTFTEDFETVPVPPAKYLFWPEKASFAGDFAGVYPRMSDIDPCRENTTPIAGFIDEGQIVRNGPNREGVYSTGGSTSPGVNYGVPGNYVVNYNGGLSFGEVSLYNELWSPEIAWDMPGPDDDDPSVAGAVIRFMTWRHLPLINGHFFIWHVRSAQAGDSWSQWRDRNFVYYGTPGVWTDSEFEVTDLLEPAPERVQMALGVLDYASIFGFPGTAGTPSPVFDDARFYKYRLPGPAFAARNIDLANDGFPVNGSIDVSSAAARGTLDIPFDMARDVNSGDLSNVPGDSIIFNVNSNIPGADVIDVRMVWALKTNAVFEDALRAQPSRLKDQNVDAGPAGSVWTGEVIADSTRTATYYVTTGGLFVDLPDVDFMYPGDVLHYYIRAIDSDGRVSTMPHDTSGFLDFTPGTVYDRTFTVRGLPTITDTVGAQPGILVWNDFGHRGGENEWISAFQQLGYAEGVDYDTYTTMGPTSGVGNGLGSSGAHGAAFGQLAGYHHFFYFAGNLSTFLLSNGSNTQNNDKGDDVGLLEQWHDLEGPRNAVYFGDYIATALVNDSAQALAYLGGQMGVAFGDHDVRDVIGGQTAPIVVPNASGPYASSFGTSYVAYGGCLTVNQFDQIQPGAGAAAGHLFTTADGVPIPEKLDPALGGVASVVYPHGNGVDITFPYASFYVYDVRARAVGLGARALLFQEILGIFGASGGTSPIVASPKAARVSLAVAPNPFNPNTTVRFTAPLGSRGAVKVFNLRGELVKTLHSGEFRTQEFRWNGVDERGASVASGVYVVQASADGTTQSAKIALVK